MFYTWSPTFPSLHFNLCWPEFLPKHYVKLFTPLHCFNLSNQTFSEKSSLFTKINLQSYGFFTSRVSGFRPNFFVSKAAILQIIFDLFFTYLSFVTGWSWMHLPQPDWHPTCWKTNLRTKNIKNVPFEQIWEQLKKISYFFDNLIEFLILVAEVAT